MCEEFKRPTSFFKGVDRRIILRKTITKAIISTTLMLSILLSALCGCSGGKIYADDLMVGISAESTKERDIDETFRGAYYDFALSIYQEARKSADNTMLSPLSIMLALSMCANGAAGQTLSQMESVLGGIPIDTLNEYLYTYTKAMSSSDDLKLNVSNSIWIKDDPNFSVKEDFLKKNATYYSAGAYKAPFDESTVKEINDMISENTDGMIKKMLDRIDADEKLFLINTILFDAEWENKYESDNIKKGATFTSLSGKAQKVTMMSSSEQKYIESDDCKGFLRPYKGNGYYFVALLPNADVDFDDFAASLDGQKFGELLGNVEGCNVDVRIPEFESEYKNNKFAEILRHLGMTDAFESYADFSKMSDNKLCISRVIHQTKIEVNADGTKAAGATIIGIAEAGMIIADDPPKSVVLDRPFVYAIVDNETMLPIFIGEITEMK